MMTKFQREIFESLLNLRRHLDQNIKPMDEFRGVCAIVYHDLSKLQLYDSERMEYLDAIREFKELCKEWPEGTGDYQYPVPALHEGKSVVAAMRAYNSTDPVLFWLQGPYAKCRYNLICYLLIRYKDM